MSGRACEPCCCRDWTSSWGKQGAPKESWTGVRGCGCSLNWSRAREAYEGAEASGRRLESRVRLRAAVAAGPGVGMEGRFWGRGRGSVCGSNRALPEGGGHIPGAGALTPRPRAEWRGHRALPESGNWPAVLTPGLGYLEPVPWLPRECGVSGESGRAAGTSRPGPDPQTARGGHPRRC